jgi:hypothetical protein
MPKTLVRIKRKRDEHGPEYLVVKDVLCHGSDNMRYFKLAKTLNSDAPEPQTKNTNEPNVNARHGKPLSIDAKNGNKYRLVKSQTFDATNTAVQDMGGMLSSSCHVYDAIAEHNYLTRKRSRSRKGSISEMEPSFSPLMKSLSMTKTKPQDDATPLKETPPKEVAPKEAPQEDYVYDIYSLQTSCVIPKDCSVATLQWNDEIMYDYCDSSSDSEYGNNDDEDSNSESYWANDYPDEDYRYYGYDHSHEHEENDMGDEYEDHGSSYRPVGLFSTEMSHAHAYGHSGHECSGNSSFFQYSGS